MSRNKYNFNALLIVLSTIALSFGASWLMVFKGGIAAPSSITANQNMNISFLFYWFIFLVSLGVLTSFPLTLMSRNS